SLDTEVDLKGGRMKFYDKVMYDSDMHGIRTATFKEVFERSSNVGMASLAFKSYGKKADYTNFYKGLQRMGLTQKTGIEIAGEPEPFIKDPLKKGSAWSGLTVPWMAHGYELKMTPLQILNVYNAVANDGVMLRPHLTKEIRREGKILTKVSPQVLNKSIASPRAIKDAQELLTSVAERGTARKLKIDNVSFAGKTGTTVINYWKGNDKKEYNASFAGYFPAVNPQYSMIVVVYEPKGHFYGAEVAGKVFARVVERISGMSSNLSENDKVEEHDIAVESQTGYSTDFKGILDFIGIDYGDESSSRWVEMDERNDEVVIAKKNITKNKVPDLRGMGLRDATYVIESLGMVAEAEGVGQVYKQSVTPGASVKDQKIKIYLN
ncbi:penicillin-binding transpeptidase domain-containing protein, partial [Saprospiraceae bacterium]|nr:penicillin-binding transpeptidase domain-containing protein [Saprospiraceae bacterium]